MNWKRIILGGLAAGLVMNVIDFLEELLVLGDRYKALQQQNIFLSQPRLPFVPLWILGIFAMGLILAWLYAAVRPRLGPGPKTAFMVGLACGLLAHVAYPFCVASWGQEGRFLPMVWMVGGLVQYIFGALVAGLLYREP